MKLKCRNTVQIGDGKQKQPFTKGKIYSGSPTPGIPNEIMIEGDREKRGGGNWQGIAAFPSGYSVLGVATFEEVKE